MNIETEFGKIGEQVLCKNDLLISSEPGYIFFNKDRKYAIHDFYQNSDKTKWYIVLYNEGNRRVAFADDVMGEYFFSKFELRRKLRKEKMRGLYKGLTPSI